MTKPNGRARLLAVYVQCERLSHPARQRVKRAAEAEADALLRRHPGHDIWAHMFAVEGAGYVLTSRIAVKNGQTIVDVTEAPAGLTKRTILQPRDPQRTKEGAKQGRSH